jgi:ATP adenylyltransferase
MAVDVRQRLRLGERLAHGNDREAYIVRRGPRTAVVLNAYPYGSGHLMVIPTRHLGQLEELDAEETTDLWATVTDAVRAVKSAYAPGGVNLGANLGQAAGAGIPGHLHVHVLPRWEGDTNFMTSVAETRVLPEPLTVTYEKITAAWPPPS